MAKSTARWGWLMLHLKQACSRWAPMRAACTSQSRMKSLPNSKSPAPDAANQALQKPTNDAQIADSWALHTHLQLHV